MLNSLAKNQASAYIKTPSSCPSSCRIFNCMMVPLQLLTWESWVLKQHRWDMFHTTAAGFPRDRYSIPPRLLSPIKIQWRGQAVLVPTFSRPGEVYSF